MSGDPGMAGFSGRRRVELVKAAKGEEAGSLIDR